MAESLLVTNRYRRYYQNLEPLLKTPQAQAYLMIILSLMTIAFFGTLAIRPTLKTIATLQRQIEDRSFLNQKLEEKINSLIVAQEEYQQIAPTLPLIYTLLPEQAEFPSLLRRLEILTVEHSATISGIQFSPIVLYGDKPAVFDAEKIDEITSDTATRPISFTLSITGDYQNLVNLLTQLTRLDRLVTIHSVNISVNQNNQAQLDLGIESAAYYYPTTL